MDADRVTSTCRFFGGCRGLSLVDVLLVLTVTAMLASGVIRMYRDYLQRNSVADMTNALGAGRVVAERYFFDRRTYVAAPCPADNDDFAITCELAPLEFKLTAKGRNSMEGFVYTLDQSGQRSSAGPWGTGACWLMHKHDKC